VSAIRLSIRDGETELAHVQTKSVDDFYYFRDSIHNALEQGKFGSRFPTFLSRFEPAEWTPAELDLLQQELQTIAEAFKKIPPEQFDEFHGFRRQCASLFDVYVDAWDKPLLGKLIALCAAAKKVGKPIAMEEADGDDKDEGSLDAASAEPTGGRAASSEGASAVSLHDLFKELAIVVPKSYDGCCFRCSKGEGRDDGLCVDCRSACGNSAQGFTETVRAELRKATWYVSSLGANPPPPQCPECDGTPAAPPDFICVDSPDLVMGETIFSFYLCPTCDAYILRRNRFRPGDGGPHPVLVGGGIPHGMGDRDVEQIRGCSTPQDVSCGCEGHRHFTRMAKFMELKEADREAARNAGATPPEAKGPFTPAQVITDPDFARGVVKAMALGEVRRPDGKMRPPPPERKLHLPPVDQEQRRANELQLAKRVNRFWYLSAALSIVLLPLGLLWGPFLIARARRFRRAALDQKVREPGNVTGIFFLGMLCILAGCITPFVLYVLYVRTPLPAELYLDNGTANVLTYRVDGEAPHEVVANSWTPIRAAPGTHHIVALNPDGSIAFDQTVSLSSEGKYIVNPGSKRRYTVRSQVYKGTNAEPGEAPPPVPIPALDFIDVSSHRYVFRDFPQSVEVWTKKGASGRLVQTGVFIVTEK